MLVFNQNFSCGFEQCNRSFFNSESTASIIFKILAYLAGVRNQGVNQDLHGQLVGHELSLAHNPSDFLTLFGSLHSKA